MFAEKTQSGFIALITAIVLSVVLIIISIALNRVGFLTRAETLDAEYKMRSQALSEACADLTLLKLTTNPSYSGNETLSVGADSCNIFTFDPSTNPIVFETIATFQQATTHLQIKASKVDLSIVSWDEIP